MRVESHSENPLLSELADCLAKLEELSHPNGSSPTPEATQYAREFLGKMVFYGAALPDEIRATETGGIFLGRDGRGIEIRADGTMVI
jgi:hypothetical protein